MLMRYSLFLGGALSLLGAVPACSQEKLSLVYSFKGGTDGYQPRIPLAIGNGLLYGATSLQGPNRMGTIFSFDPSTGVETPISSGMAVGGPLNAGGFLFHRGLLYGVLFGGAYKNGEIFSLDPKSGTPTTLYTFGGNADGKFPAGPLIAAGDVLYGVTEQGGTGGVGTVFKFDLKTNALKTIYTFTGQADGANPLGPLAELNGMLYGTTTDFASGTPTIFAVDPAAGTETTLYTFPPIGGVSQDVRAGLIGDKTMLYGTTFQSGSGTDQLGSVYSYDVSSGVEKTLYFFQPNPDGQGPQGPLVKVGDVLYGTTFRGGETYGGDVFKVNAMTGDYTILAYPAGEDGLGAAVTPLNGMLYGVQAVGGARKKGAIFAIPQ